MLRKMLEVQKNNYYIGHLLDLHMLPRLKELGLIKYTRYIVLPSVFFYWYGVEYDEYYSQPWEYGADLYGGVKRDNYKYDENVLENYNNYFSVFEY